MSISNSKVFAERIYKVLEYLKQFKILQTEIEDRLNYTSLSKAKNYDQYPQTIIERKTREELFNLILESYNLIYDEESDSFQKKESEITIKKDNNTLYYIMYYYAFARQTTGRAIVQIINNKRVIMDYRLDEHWEGTYNVIENYTFIFVEKLGGVTPVQKLICLFSGTKKHGRPILLGTYSTIKRDGFPAAGKIVFERINDKKLIGKKLKSEPDPRIAYYLKDNVLVSDTFTPNTLNDLTNKYKIINRYVGEYYFFYYISGKIMKAEMSCHEDSKVYLNIDKITYSGSLHPIDNHTMRIEVNDDVGFSDIGKNVIVLFMSLSKSSSDPFYCCSGISNALNTHSIAFKSLIIEKDLYDSNSQDKVKQILDKQIGSKSL